LFQNRYKSALVGSASYLLEVIRYVHLNPVRARLVSSLSLLSEYPWTSHYEILRSGNFPWEEFPEVEAFFSDGGSTDPMILYLDFLATGEGEGWSADRADGFEGFHAVLSAHEEDFRTLPEKESLKREFLDIVSHCSEEFGTMPARIFTKRRDRGSVNARKKILHTCVVERGMERTSVCKWLGLTPSGGSYLLREG
jgi:putative transposase